MLTMCPQNLVKGFKELGHKPEVQPVSSFQDDYGLKTGEGDKDEEDEEDDEESGSDDEMTDASDA